MKRKSISKHFIYTLVAIIIIIGILYVLFTRVFIKTYINVESIPNYKLSYPAIFHIEERFEEEEPGVMSNCIAITSDDFHFHLGIAIHRNHHPCYIQTIGFPDNTVEVKYVIQAKNSTFEVTEKHGTYDEIDQYGDYHPPNERNVVSLYGEGEDEMYFSYVGYEDNYMLSIKLIRWIISSITWI